MKHINNSNNASNMNVKTVNQENNSMDNNFAQNVFDARRQFVPGQNAWGQAASFNEEQIKLMTPENIIRRLFAEGRIRITNNANASRKNAIAALFMNGPQADQFGRTLANFETVGYIGQTMTDTAGFKSIALVDPKTNHDILVYEKKQESGWIGYTVYYASKQYNQHGQVIGLIEGQEDPIQEWLKQSIEEGYVGRDGVARQSHNQWARAYNDALKAVAIGNATAVQRQMVAKAKPEVDPNLFVRNNSKQEINWESVANKYAMLAWLVTAQNDPAFEIYNRAKTAESNMNFINGLIKMATRGYQNQLKSLSGLYSNNDVAE